MTWDLVADVGGTNMRLAAFETYGSPDNALSNHRNFTTKGGVSFPQACMDLIAAIGSPPQRVVIAAAGVVRDGAVLLTNAETELSEAHIAQTTGARQVKILNDFEAAAWSLAAVAEADITPLQGRCAATFDPRLIIGPGTGLGVGAMVWHQGKPLVISGEGGHVTLAPHSEEELLYFKALIEIWPEVQVGRSIAVEAEAILSGTGLPKFYTAIAQATDEQAPLSKSRDIFSAALAKSDPSAVTAVTLFERYLGTVAGDLGLVFNAKGGVFITGGVVQSNPWVLGTQFLQAFNAGGRHSQWREDLPVSLYHHIEFGLLGARNYLIDASL